jgi:hypothetical protein
MSSASQTPHLHTTPRTSGLDHICALLLTVSSQRAKGQPGDCVPVEAQQSQYQFWLKREGGCSAAYRTGRRLWRAEPQLVSLSELAWRSPPNLSLSIF